jgi:RsiW-degrading membrane proteinase PrsW (M82 family)
MSALGVAGNSGPGDSGALWMFRDPEPPSSATVQLLRAFVVAGVVEEVAKLLAVILVTHRALSMSEHPDSEAASADGSTQSPTAHSLAPRHGPVLLRHGAATGMGFAVLEAAAQLVGSAGFVVLRVVMVIPLHAALTGIVFVAVGGSIARRARGGRGRPAIAGVISVTLAATVHGAFNLVVGPIVVGAAMIVAAVLIVAIVTNGVVVSENAGRGDPQAHQ